jgi:hypothetical protein
LRVHETSCEHKTDNRFFDGHGFAAEISKLGQFGLNDFAAHLLHNQMDAALHLLFHQSGLNDICNSFNRVGNHESDTG